MGRVSEAVLTDRELAIREPDQEEPRPCPACGEMVFPGEPGAVLVNNAGWCCSDACAYSAARGMPQ